MWSTRSNAEKVQTVTVDWNSPALKSNFRMKCNFCSKVSYMDRLSSTMMSGFTINASNSILKSKKNKKKYLSTLKCTN